MYYIAVAYSTRKPMLFSEFTYHRMWAAGFVYSPLRGPFRTWKEADSALEAILKELDLNSNERPLVTT